MRLWSAKPSFVWRSSDLAAPGGIRFDAVRPRRGHVEEWFLKANDPSSTRALSLRWTIWAGERDPRRAVAEAWALAFGAQEGHVATKVAVPFSRASFGRSSLGIEVDGATLAEDWACGRVESGGRTIAYDVGFRAAGGAQVGAAGGVWSDPSSAGALPSRADSFRPDVRVRGTVIVSSEAWALHDWPGSLGHRWGRAHAGDRAWGHCNAWNEGEDVVMEGFTARPRVGLVPFPSRTELLLRVGAEQLRLAGSSSRVGSTQAEGSISPRRWRFRARSVRVEIEGELWADTEDFVGLFLPNPDGTTVHCLDTKLASAELTVRFPGLPPRTLRSKRAALEIATRDPHHGVRMHV